MFDLGASAEPTNIARDKDKLIGESAWMEYLRDIGGAPPQQVRRRKTSGR
jgi:hypothetical protein